MFIWTKKKKIALIVVIILVVWFIVGRLITGYVFRFVKISDSVFASTDQVNVINSFGYPDVFLLSMDDKNRYDAWTYFDIEREFTFINGEFQNANPIDNIGEDFQFPEFRSTQFKNGIGLKKVNKILGDPTAQAQIAPNIMENTEIYDYWDQVKVGIKDGKVVFVQTLPVLIPEQFRVQEND